MTRSKKLSEEPPAATTLAVLKTVTSPNRVADEPRKLLERHLDMKENTNQPPFKPMPPLVKAPPPVALKQEAHKPLPPPLQKAPIKEKAKMRLTRQEGAGRYNMYPRADRGSPPCPQYKAEKGYKCPKCQRCYNARKNLVRHVTLECGRDPQYKCPYCSYSKHRRNELKKHLEKKHPNHPSSGRLASGNLSANDSNSN